MPPSAAGESNGMRSFTMNVSLSSTGFVLPAIGRAMIVAMVSPPEIVAHLREFREWNGDGGPRRLRELFRAAVPSLEFLAQVYAARSFNVRRKFERQDFFDIEHAGLALVYVDAFATRDRGLLDLLPRGVRRPPDARARIIASLAELTAWLSASAQ